jgi:hypothetical protein
MAAAGYVALRLQPLDVAAGLAMEREVKLNVEVAELFVRPRWGCFRPTARLAESRVGERRRWVHWPEVKGAFSSWIGRQVARIMV